MRLISLTANKETFRSIYFNQSGLTLIRAKQEIQNSIDKGKTYNGVGKSLAVTLIHFCLGSNKVADFEIAIPDWEFSLEFEIAGKNFTSRRNTSEQNIITLNDEDIGVRKFGEMLQNKAFNLDKSYKGLTFRPLISRFIRPKKASYVTFDGPLPKEKPYESLLRNAYLLGLDVDLIKKKMDLFTKREKIREFRSNLEKDTIFLEFFTGFKDIEIEMKDLDENIYRLEKDMSTFKVAENFYDVQQEANFITGHLQQLRNRTVVLQNAIRNITISLEKKTDIPIERIKKVYSETSASMPGVTLKRLEEVVQFHERLSSNRSRRLIKEKEHFENEQFEVKDQVEKLSRNLNEKLKFLGDHGALDEFAKLSHLVGELKAQSQKLQDYKDLLSKYDEQQREIKVSLITEAESASKYLKRSTGILENNLSLFRSFSRRFYPDKPGGLTVINNEGDNQIRFNIHAKIQDDASDGINEVKIFCFDMTLLMARHNHNINFIFHDSRLFSDIDPRQRATLFKIAYEQSVEENIQYIATINEDQINSMRELFTGDEFENIFTKNIVLDLTDESITEKLLGIQVDMHYE